ncbi:MAG: endonuclease NucS [Methanothrix sp.]|nr:endonuclease NucS [Methanothrix sp.]
MLTERDFEDILCKYPDLIEDGLALKGRQVGVYGRRMDLLFEDRSKRKLIVELKIGPIKDGHIGQIMSYEGTLLSAEDPTVRIMLIGNRVPPNIQRSLDHHGIAWKEITYSQLKEFLRKRGDEQFLKLLLEENQFTIIEGKTRDSSGKLINKMESSKLPKFQSSSNNLSVGKMKAVELIRAFEEYVESNPNNRHNKYLSFYWGKRLKPHLGNRAWDEVEKDQHQISEEFREYGAKKKEKLSDRSIELAWKGLAYSYQFGVDKLKIIKDNPFIHLLPKKPRSGSYID